MRRCALALALSMSVACSVADAGTRDASETDDSPITSADSGASDSNPPDADHDAASADPGSDASTVDAGPPGSDAGPSPAGFVHPGILVNEAMLAFVKDKLASRQEPWQGALDAAAASSYGRLSYTPHPREVVECGSHSMPDVGCSDEKNDTLSAYTHALLWYHTRDEAHAAKAIEIMNGWSAVLREHTNTNAPLQAAWIMETLPRAAEILRYTYDGWADDEITRFSAMLRDVYLPLIEGGSGYNGNWELSMIEGVMNIAVFNDDQALFDRAVTMWRERVPAYLYLESDGATPVPPPRGEKTGEALITFWYGQRTFVSGLAQETCRDFGHVQYGLAAIVNAAETARIQGIDLYGEQEERIRQALGFHARYLNGAVVPSWLCGGALTDVRAAPMWEIAYQHYGVRRANDMPQTRILTMNLRPSGADHHMAWETLTHGDLGATGLR